LGLTNLAATFVQNSKTMVEEQDVSASAGPATDHDVTLDVLAAVEELVPTCGFAQVLRAQRETRDWSPESAALLARVWQKDKWPEPAPPGREENCQHKKFLALVLERASLSTGAARYCAGMLVWALERRDWPFPNAVRLYADAFECMKHSLGQAPERGRNIGLFTKLLLSYAHSLADDLQAFWKKARHNLSFSLEEQHRPLMAKDWRELCNTWAVLAEHCATELIKKEERDTVETWVRGLQGLFGGRKRGSGAPLAAPDCCPLSLARFKRPLCLPSGYSVEQDEYELWNQVCGTIGLSELADTAWMYSPSLLALQEVPEEKNPQKKPVVNFAMEEAMKHETFCHHGYVKNILPCHRNPLTGFLLGDPVIMPDGSTRENPDEWRCVNPPNLALRAMLERMREVMPCEMGCAAHYVVGLKHELRDWSQHVNQVESDVYTKHRSALLAGSDAYGPLTRVATKHLDERRLAAESNMNLTIQELMHMLYETVPSVRFEVFGSAMNGFGDEDADIDLSASLIDPNADDDKKQVLERIVSALTGNDRVVRDSITAVLSARVPVLKFLCKRSQGPPVEVDICVSNILGCANTQLLRTYANLDPRVSILGKVVKAWAKKSRIVGTQDGMLNSYTYVLMVIDFLQNCTPPVLPCLSEASEGIQPTTRIETEAGRQKQTHVVSFCHNPKWASENKSSVGKLLAEFFAYFGRDFDWASNVVTIRRSSKERTPQQMSEGKDWVIEDPFELWRNMAGQSSEHGRCHILSALRHGLALCTPSPGGAPPSAAALTDLCPPRADAERWFIRSPLGQRSSEEIHVLLQTAFKVLRQGPKLCMEVESHEPGHRNFNRELYYEFPTKTSRNEGLSVAHQAAQVNKTAQAAPYLFFMVGGDMFLQSLGEATSIKTLNSGGHPVINS
jgi:terminal uridylyltransferase